MKLTISQMERALDKLWEIDEHLFLRLWEPDMLMSVMLNKLLEENPALYATVTGMKTLEKVSSTHGIPLKKLLRKDLLRAKHRLICSHCSEVVGYVPELESRICPMCRIGRLEEISRKELEKLV